MTDWHALSIEAVFSKLKTNKHGLSSKKAAELLKKYGPNELQVKNKLSAFKIFIYQFKNVMTLMLIIASLISFLINEFIDAVTILIILIINVILGFVQEYKAEKAMQALKSLASPKCVVVRDGVEKVIWSRELVPGDIVVLNVGDIVPANVRLFDVVNLKVNQANITGESVPVMKDIKQLPLDTPLAERSNIAFMGSVVSYGKARGVVTATGMDTEIGKIAVKVASEKREMTPLQKEINTLGKWLAAFAIIAVIIVFGVGIFLNKPFFEMLLTSVSLAVSAVPEGLPAVITITLAVGMQRMASRNAVVRKLSAVQTLGNVTIICSDKTGTLTKNEMTVTKIYDGFNNYSVSGIGYEPKGEFFMNGRKINPFPALKNILVCGSLCNNAYYGSNNGRYNIIGDPTEGCLLVAAAKAGMWQSRLKKDFREILELSFTSERKMMSVVYEKDGKGIVYSKGAPEVMINLCTRIQKGNRIVKLTKKKKEEIIRKNKELAESGLRLLLLAYREVNLKDINKKEIENDFIFLGLAGMMDPARPEVKEAIKVAQKAGIRVVIITGDNILTTIAVAKQIGLFNNESVAFTGSDLDKMTEEEFKDAVRTGTIFARTSPEHKFKIVSELKEMGEIVAVTGDGINDAPALKTAHIGIAMGIKGTDVSKEAAEMVLTDDNFSTIVNAVEEGRGIFDNIKKFIKFLLSANADTISEVMASILLGLPLPFLPVQILWMNLVTDGLPALALSADPKEKGIMKRKPRDPNKSLMQELVIFIIVAGLVDALSSIILFITSLSIEGYFITRSAEALIKARTMAISSAIIYELFFVFNCRSDNKSIWERSFRENFLSNKFLTFSVIISVLLQLMIIYIPPFQIIFKTTSLSIWEMALVLFFASWGLFIIPKWFHKEFNVFKKKVPNSR